MILQNQPNRWSCLPTSLAMLSDKSFNEIIALIGHDGSEIVFKDLPEPQCRRSFLIEEIQYITPTLGFVLVPYFPGVVYKPQEKLSIQVDFPQLGAKMMERDGIIFGYPMGRTLGHVVAWSALEALIYDPNGTKYPADAGYFVIETFYGKYPCTV
jgi:hypothetical protein